MKFLTQAFSRGFFRNSDARPAQLRITKFQSSQDPEGTTEWFIECQRLRAPIESARNDKPYAGVTVTASVPLLAPRERPLTIGECIARLRALP